MRQDATIDKAEGGRRGRFADSDCLQLCFLPQHVTLALNVRFSQHDLLYMTSGLGLDISHKLEEPIMAYIETPRTDAGNATYMTNSHDLDNFSAEPSLLSPLKRKDDIVSQMRSGRGIDLKTPRARVPLADRRNLPGRTEFTPLLQSVARKRLERNGKLSGAPETPAFLKASYLGGDSPALPRDVSGVYGSDIGSSMLGDGDGTPMPQVASSSAQSTPLAVLPKRDATGVMTDQGNMMTLREQENVSLTTASIYYYTLIRALDN